MSVQEWRNHNHYRSYPFEEDSCRRSGAFELPNDTVIDVSFISHLSEVGTGKLTLTSIAVAVGGTDITFTFTYGGYYPMTIVVPAAFSDVYEGSSRLDIQAGTAWILLKVLFSTGVQAIVADVSTHGNTYTFDDGPIPVLDSNVAQRPSSLVASVGYDEELVGDVTLSEGYNISVRVIPTTNTIRISAKIGAGMGIPCTPMLAEPADCPEGIFYINGLHPDWSGRFNLTSGGKIQVDNDPGANKITLSTNINPDNPRCES